MLFEEAADEAGLICGYAENYVKVYARGSAADFNGFQKVKLLTLYQAGLKGELLP